MIIRRKGDSYTSSGKTFVIGTEVFANENSDYYGLKGKVSEIRIGKDIDTDNEGPDIYVEFNKPKDSVTRIMIENRFSMLYGVPKKISDISIDEVIMNPEMLDVREQGRL